MAGIGEIIKRRRKSLGLSQTQVCEMVDTDQPHLSQIERGVIKTPETALIRRFSSALDLPLLELMKAAGLVVEVVLGSSGAAWVPLRGRVPADSVRWTELETKGQSVEIPQAWAESARAPLFAVTVSGDCLANLGIINGDVVICETYEQKRQVRNGTVVLVRVGDQYTLKAYHRVGTVVELRDGTGTVVHSVTPADDYEILGTFYERFGGRFLSVRTDDE